MTSYDAPGKPLTSPRLSESGSVTREWMLGSDNPEQAQVVEIYKGTISGGVSRRYVTAHYSYRVDGGPRRDYGRDLSGLRRMIRKNFPNAKTVNA